MPSSELPRVFHSGLRFKSCRDSEFGMACHPEPQAVGTGTHEDWVAVEELNLSYHNMDIHRTKRFLDSVT